MSTYGAEASAARARFWVADRDAREVVGLDANLLVVARAAHDWPVRIAARSDAGAWVALATTGNPVGPHALRRISHSAATLGADVALDPLLDLESRDGDQALTVTLNAGGARQVAIHASDGTLRVVPAAADALSVCARGAELLVGSEQGALELRDFANPAQVLAVRAFGGIIADLAPGPRRGTWWVLDASGSANHRRLALLDANLATLWQRPVGLNALQLAPEPGVESVWVVDSTAPLARRFGPGGVLEIDSAPLSLAGAERALARPGGGALFTAPGALLALDDQGAGAPGQGGFDFLVDVSARW